MNPTTRKLILVGIGLILLIILATVCSDILRVVAIASLAVNLLMFAEVGHKTWGEVADHFSGDAVEVVTPEAAVPVSIDTATQVQQALAATDTYGDTYLPPKNVGHISSYYESPMLEPAEMFPQYYGDIDDAVVGFEKRRIRDKQAIDGQVNKSADHYRANYRSEFADSEARDWYGNADV